MEPGNTASAYTTRWRDSRAWRKFARGIPGRIPIGMTTQACPTKLAGQEEYPVQGGGSEPFLVYANLRGQEQALVDLVINPEMVHYCMDAIYSLAFTNSLRLYETLPGKINISWVAEDMGSQEDLIFSPAQVREFFLPWMRRMIDLAHQAGVAVFHHSDGAIRKIIPDMIEAGIDVLNPIQWRCKGMDRKGLKRDFGDRVIFHGGIDNQQTLAFGSVDDVEEEVMANLQHPGRRRRLYPGSLPQHPGSQSTREHCRPV